MTELNIAAEVVRLLGLLDRYRETHPGTKAYVTLWVTPLHRRVGTVKHCDDAYTVRFGSVKATGNRVGHADKNKLIIYDRKDNATTVDLSGADGAYIACRDFWVWMNEQGYC